MTHPWNEKCDGFLMAIIMDVWLTTNRAIFQARCRREDLDKSVNRAIAAERRGTLHSSADADDMPAPDVPPEPRQ